MLNINEKMIRINCPSLETFKRGEGYYLKDAVKNLKYYDKSKFFHANVIGTYRYQVQVDVNPEGRVVSAECDCPAFYQYEGFCKHIVAVLLKIKKDYAGRDLNSEKTKEVLSQMLNFVSFKGNQKAYNKVALKVEPTLVIDRYFSSQTSTSLTLKIGDKKSYVVKDVEKFFDAIEKAEPMVFGKNFFYDPAVHVFSSEDQPLIDIIKEIYEMDKLLTLRHGYYSSKDKLISGKEVALSPIFSEKVLQILKERSFNLDLFGQKYEGIEVIEADLPLHFSITKESKELKLSLDTPKIIPLSHEGRFFFYQGKIYFISPEQQQNLSTLNYGFGQLGLSISIPVDYQEAFMSELYPCLKRTGKVKVDDKALESFIQEPFQAEVYLDQEEGLFTVEIKYIYGNHSFNPFDRDPKLELVKDKILIRDKDRERRLMSFFEDSDFKINAAHKVYLDEEEKIFDFIYDTLPNLHSEAQVYYSDRLKINSMRPAPTFKGKVSLNSNLDLLEISFQLEGINHEELIEIYSSLKEKRKFHRLRDGSFLSLNSDNFTDMVDFIDALDLKKSDLKEEALLLPKYKSIQVDQFFQENKLKSFKKDKAFKELSRNLREPQEADFDIPTALEPTLRNYQKSGFNWLKTMATYGFGGILADDMGLGKTLQAITFIASEQENKKDPVLVVTPTSVVYNWQGEIEKFAPDLRSQVISGSKGERDEKLRTMDEFDIIITSYALLRRDMDSYQNKNFSYLILDEAQYIKNPNSQTAKAAKEIKAGCVFALTGTPIENSLTELWSIFDCLMPGYLSSFNKFMDRYGKAGEKIGDENTTQSLAKKVNPFILRRLKKDVLTELPEKIENTLKSELTKEQKKLYLAYLEKVKNELLTEFHAQGFDKSKLKILAAITRLRQICCHPSLFVEDYQGDSGKLLQLQEIVQAALAGGHRILIFSQFTKMLKIIGQRLAMEDLDYFYLDGSIKSEKRLEMVQAFNSGEKNIFLISLKAGGTGLNLTGADTVIHFDLWWNPAVEDQASDRAYRLGQKRTVQVMKLISLGTIEEKIYALQQKKKELIDKIITPGEQLITSLTEEDIKELLEI